MTDNSAACQECPECRKWAERVRDLTRALERAEKNRVAAVLSTLSTWAIWLALGGVVFLGFRWCVRDLAFGQDARRNAEREAAAFVRAMYPQEAAAGVSAVCSGLLSEEGNHLRCEVRAGVLRVSLWCDDDYPRRNDGCVLPSRGPER